MDMLTSSAKQKGRRLQQKVRDLILETFSGLEEDDVRSTSMGAGGEDILLSPLARKKVPLAIECKNQEAFGNAVMWNSIKQAQENSNGHIPTVVFSKNREKEYVILSLTDLMKLLKEKDNG